MSLNTSTNTSVHVDRRLTEDLENKVQTYEVCLNVCLIDTSTWYYLDVLAWGKGARTGVKV